MVETKFLSLQFMETMLLKKPLEKNLIALPNETMMDRIVRDAIKKFINKAFIETEKGNIEER